MADFVQNNVTQSAVRELAEPIADNEKNKKPGPTGSGEQGTGQKITDPGIHKAARTKTAPRLVKRVTALIRQTIARPQEPKSTHRRRTQLDIYGKDPEIPYVKFEAASRDLVCSLMERQDRMNEEIFSKINDLGYRVEYLEQDRNNDGSGR
ncbi:MAG: hypothetical protein Q7U51_15635 [Methanoregula sp.]|nr:hypothetical protein [Methanoregula sp.]